MAKKRKPQASLLAFQKRFPDEAACASFLFERRWPEGFICPRCSKGRAVLLRTRAWTYECLDCGRQMSVTAGTALHRTKMPLSVWFWAAHLMAAHSNGMFALQIKGQLGISYRTAWLLAQKLRRSMVDPGREPLEGVVEIDQTEAVPRRPEPFQPRQRWQNPRRRRRRSLRPNQRNAAETESDRREIPRYPVGPHPAAVHSEQRGRAHSRLHPRRHQVRDDAALRRAPVLSRLRRLSARPARGRQNAGHVALPWIHRVFSLMNRWGLGTYHGLRRRHIDTYLNEYVCRYNRRFYRHVSFETILGIAANRPPISRWDIVGRANPRVGRPIKRLNPRRRRTARRHAPGPHSSADQRRRNPTLSRAYGLPAVSWSALARSGGMAVEAFTSLSQSSGGFPRRSMPRKTA
jgi:predicted RNA-binding Zn-ribbon protein involved in translation (DUF1610 family)